MGNIIDKLKGKLKKAEGRATGDKVRQGQGWAEEKKADVKDAIDNAADKASERVERARDERRPDEPRR